MASSSHDVRNRSQTSLSLPEIQQAEDDCWVTLCSQEWYPDFDSYSAGGRLEEGIRFMPIEKRKWADKNGDSFIYGLLDSPIRGWIILGDPWSKPPLAQADDWETDVISSQADMSQSVLSLRGDSEPGPIRRRCCGATTDKDKRYTISRLRNSMIVGILGIYHIYWFFAAMIIGFALGINILLSWYIEWFQYTAGNGTENMPLGKFSAVFVRSCLLITFLSHLTRIAVWLMHDALRLEAFQVYRRMLCFDAMHEFAKGKPDAIYVLKTERGWKYTERWKGWWDVLMQVCIYFTFDILPLIMAIVTTVTDSAAGAVSTWCIYACGAALVHVLVFAGFELLNDVAAKFIAARRHLRRHHDRALRRNRSNPSVDREESSTPLHFVGDDKDLDQTMSERSFDSLRDVEAQDDVPWNLCVLICSCLQLPTIVVHGLFTLILLAGFAAGVYRFLQEKLYDVFVPTLCLLVGWILYKCRHLPKMCARKVEEKANMEPPREWVSFRRFRRWAADSQKWAEVHCGLADQHAAPHYELLGIVTPLQVLLFWYIDWRPGMWLMLAMFAFLIARRLTIGIIKPFGWMVGLIENFAVVLAAIIINGVQCDGWYAAGCFLLSAGVQFKCSRQHQKSWRLLLWVTFALHFLLLIIVAVSMMALIQGKDADSWSNFSCDPQKDPGCYHFATNQVPKRFGNYGYEFCDLNFPLSAKKMDANPEDELLTGTGPHPHPSAKTRTLRLPQFAMMSALAYDSNATFNSSLQRWFPGWRLDYVRRVDNIHADQVTELHNDWTTFFEVTDPESNCTVFIVRGTQHPLEVLQDINVFAPIAIPQIASLIGPDLTSVAARAVLVLSTAMYGKWMQKNYYTTLLDHVKARVEEYPERSFYITGHSLGGGLAKLVSIETNVPAVTFSSPGVAATRDLVANNGQDGRSLLHRASYTVIPDNDIVPRVDGQLGVQIPINCNAAPWACHSSGETLCDLVYSCGSKLDQPVEIDCALCPRHAHLFDACRNHTNERYIIPDSSPKSSEVLQI